MLKKAIRLNEARLKKIIAESVKKVLDEAEEANPEASKELNEAKSEHERWRQQKIEALYKLREAIWDAARVYEVSDKSNHPLDQAYYIIARFIKSEGFQDEM